MKKQYVSYQDKHGNPKFREATEEELANMPTQFITWHYDECPLRVTFSDEVKQVWLNKYHENDILGTYPEISALLESVKNLSVKRVAQNGETHIYVEEIYDEHRAVLEANGAIIETKPIN